MPHHIAVSELNATTLEILNTIRDNASLRYQDSVPAVTSLDEVAQVGQVLYGTPALANEFLSALINRIALVRVQSRTYNNPLRILKKGYLEFGETVEEVFVNIARVREFSAEKAAARELKRTPPNVRSAFHVKNWDVQYPVTIERIELKKAFMSETGVMDLVERIMQSVYNAANYDEYLLTKYLMIKGINAGAAKPLAVDISGGLTAAATAFRATSNKFTFYNNQYNLSGVTTFTPRENQVIIMSSEFNARFDVEVLAAAFNMERAEFMGRLILVDDFTTFDNDRWSEIREGSNQVEAVTSAELANMANVVAMIADEDWFQLYDNSAVFLDTQVAAGKYWNYFYSVEKTISYSPFSNAAVFVTSASDLPEIPEDITASVVSKVIGETGTILTFSFEGENNRKHDSIRLQQTEALTTAGIAVIPEGGVIIPAAKTATTITLVAELAGSVYTAATTITAAADVGDTVTLSLPQE